MGFFKGIRGGGEKANVSYGFLLWSVLFSTSHQGRNYDTEGSQWGVHKVLYYLVFCFDGLRKNLFRKLSPPFQQAEWFHSFLTATIARTGRKKLISSPRPPLRQTLLLPYPSRPVVGTVLPVVASPSQAVAPAVVEIAEAAAPVEGGTLGVACENRAVGKAFLRAGLALVHQGWDRQGVGKAEMACRGRGLELCIGGGTRSVGVFKITG